MKRSATDDQEAKPAAKRKKERPRKPHSAYNLYFKEERPKLMQHHALGTSAPDFEANFNAAFVDQKTESQALFNAASKTIADRWKAMSAEEKVTYENQAANLTIQYKKDLKEYEASMVAEAKALNEQEKKAGSALSSAAPAGAGNTNESLYRALAASGNLGAARGMGGNILGMPSVPTNVAAPSSYVLPPDYPLERLALPPITMQDPRQPERLFLGHSPDILRNHIAIVQAQRQLSALAQQRQQDAGSLTPTEVLLRQLQLQQELQQLQEAQRIRALAQPSARTSTILPNAGHQQQPPAPLSQPQQRQSVTGLIQAAAPSSDGGLGAAVPSQTAEELEQLKKLLEDELTRRQHQHQQQD